MNFPPLAAQWVAADAGVAVEENVADVVMTNLELCGVAADLVHIPAGDGLIPSGPGHHRLWQGLAHAEEGHYYFAFRVHCCSHSRQEPPWTACKQ